MGLGFGRMGAQGQVDGSVERDGLPGDRGIRIAAETADNEKVECGKRTRRKESLPLHGVEPYNDGGNSEEIAASASGQWKERQCMLCGCAGTVPDKEGAIRGKQSSLEGMLPA